MPLIDASQSLAMRIVLEYRGRFSGGGSDTHKNQEYRCSESSSHGPMDYLFSGQPANQLGPGFNFTPFTHKFHGD